MKLDIHINKRRDEQQKDMYAFRMVVYRRSDNSVMVDRTFKSRTETGVIMAFVTHMSRASLFRKYDASKCYVRVQSVAGYMVPLRLFSIIQKEVPQVLDVRDLIEEVEDENEGETKA